MEIPSHIGPNGISPIRSEGSIGSENQGSDGIELRTPPKVIKLDDSNIWGHNSTMQPSAKPNFQFQTQDSINEEYFDVTFTVALRY